MGGWVKRECFSIIVTSPFMKLNIKHDQNIKILLKTLETETVYNSIRVGQHKVPVILT